METLNAEQKNAANSNASKTVVLSGPGSGKTATLVARVAAIIAQGRAPHSIAVVTFTTTAARELRERLAAIVGDSAQRIYCGTLHSLMLRFIRQQGRACLPWLPERLTVIDEETQAEMMAEACATLRYKGGMDAVIKAIDYNFAPSTCLRPAQAVAAYYVRKCVELGFLDYDSLLAIGLQMLQAGCDPGIQHLLVDEYQDSGDMDAAIYAAIPAATKFMVGDSDQSIYQFRGGNPRHMTGLAHSGTAQVLTLESNYRSDTAICEAANSLIGHNPERFKSIKPVSTAPGMVSLRRYASDTQENSAIATEIQKRIEAGEPATDFAVLNRTNFRTNEMAKMLEAFGIPVRRRKHSERPKDYEYARQCLAFMQDPENDYLAFKIVSKASGIAAANMLKAQALEDMVSISSQIKGLLGALDFHNVAINLDLFKVSPESIAIVETIIAETGANTLDDLALALALPEADAHDEGQGVAVLTIHGAKGREWPCVYLPGWNDEDVSHAADDEKLQELRRLAFVAVTRAKHEVRVSHTDRRKPHANTTKLAEATPSRFLAEMGLIHKQETVTA